LNFPVTVLWLIEKTVEILEVLSSNDYCLPLALLFITTCSS